MEKQKIIDEINFYRAQAVAELLYDSGKITFDECDKLTELNRQTFSPMYADLLPKTLEKSSDQS
ncbi:SHOCT domain-containing protein [uncultured Ruminococcus sp.]|uniref:SHOCT domain-containing protein n=1 Tax=uncultured Ruminococcus sp. TaxID=165186 RepID=UPI00261D95D0|nr:SHOCT domain-containing protein [uncultured Ruminococcus sp.]